MRFSTGKLLKWILVYAILLSIIGAVSQEWSASGNWIWIVGICPASIFVGYDLISEFDAHDNPSRWVRFLFQIAYYSTALSFSVTACFVIEGIQDDWLSDVLEDWFFGSSVRGLAAISLVFVTLEWMCLSSGNLIALLFAAYVRKYYSQAKTLILLNLPSVVLSLFLMVRYYIFE